MKKNSARNNQAKDPQASKEPRRKGRFIRRFLFLLLVLIVVLTVIVQYGLGFIVRSGAKAAGPSLIGTEIAIQDAKVRPFFGIVDFGKMRVGPPESYKADVLKIENFKIILDPKSVFTDTIVIKEITIIGPEVTYELSGLKSNISAIMDRLAKAEKEEVEKSKKEKSKKKVVIEQFLFSGAKIRIASSATGGKGLVIPMPNIELTDIGKNSGGVTGLKAFSQIVTSVSTGILGAVRDAGLAVGKAAIDGTQAVAGAAIDTVGAVGGAAAKGTKAVTGAAVDTVGAVGGAAVDTVGAVGKTIGGIFGGSRKTNAPPKDAEEK